MKLTGRFYFKRTWLGMVLYVEWENLEHDSINTFKWKKAKERDILNLDLKTKVE